MEGRRSSSRYESDLSYSFHALAFLVCFLLLNLVAVEVTTFDEDFSFSETVEEELLKF